MMLLAFIGGWLLEVRRQHAELEAAFAELQATPSAFWSHPANARYERALARLRALHHQRNRITAACARQKDQDQ